MSIFAAPDGSSQAVNNLTVQTFRVPANAIVFLWGWPNSAWEQAVVIGIDNVRQPDQLGTFGRQNFIHLDAADHDRTLTLAGWHKRSGPDSDQPWHPSMGRTDGDMIAWDDSGGDRDFDDYRVKIGLIQADIRPKIKLSIHPLQSGIKAKLTEKAIRVIKVGDHKIAHTAPAAGRFIDTHPEFADTAEAGQLTNHLKQLLEAEEEIGNCESQQQLLKLWNLAEKYLSPDILSDLRPRVHKRLFDQIPVKKDIVKLKNPGGH